MSGRHVVLEANDLLLLVHQPSLAASPGRTVLVAGAFLEHGYNLRTETRRQGLDVIGILLLVALLVFGAGLSNLTLGIYFGVRHWIGAKKPILPIVRGKSGGRYKRIYRKRTRRSFNRYGRF